MRYVVDHINDYVYIHVRSDQVVKSEVIHSKHARLHNLFSFEQCRFNRGSTLDHLLIHVCLSIGKGVFCHQQSPLQLTQDVVPMLVNAGPASTLIKHRFDASSTYDDKFKFQGYISTFITFHFELKSGSTI